MKKVFRDLPLSGNTSLLVKEEIASQFAAPFHFHRGYEITCIVKGHGKFYGGDRLLNFAEGDIYFFGIGFPHYFVSEKADTEAGESVHSIIIQFPEDFLGRDFYLKPEFKQVKELLSITNRGVKIIQPPAAIKKLFFQLLKLSGLKALISLMQILELVSTLPKSRVMLISSDFYKDRENEPGKEDKLEAVYKYVLENFKSEVSTKRAAELAFMNEAAFCRYFKRRTNKTLSQFTNSVRITHATYLLAEKELSISNICFDCGFDNLSYFNRQFKAIVGKAPFLYRKELSPAI